MRAGRDDDAVRRAARRIGLQAAALIVLCLAAVAGVQVVLVEQSAHADARNRLVDVTGTIDRPSESPRDILVTIVRGGTAGAGGTVESSPDLPAGLPVRADLAAVERDGSTRQRSLEEGGHEYLVRTERSGDRVVQAAIDRQPIEDESRRLLYGLAVAGAVGVLLALGLASWLAARAVRPMAETIALQRRFVADASHELRTPLTLLSTRVQLLARRLGRERPDLDADVGGVVDDTRSLTEVLEELLLAADTRRTDDRALVDLGGLAGAVVDAAGAEAQRRGLGLGLAAGGPDRARLVEVAAPAVRRAVLALVDNALDHARHEVVVTVRGAGRRVVVEVADDGTGIAPDRLAHLFERFATSRPGPADEPDARRHYGLGLALVAEVATAHGGRVRAANRTGGPGAVLTLELPRARPRRSRSAVRFWSGART